MKDLRRLPLINFFLADCLRAAFAPFGGTPAVVIRHVSKVGTVRVGLPNGRQLLFQTEGDDWVSNQVFWKGWSGYEPEVSKLFWSIATASQLTLDIGAHIGYYALLAAYANPAGRVIAFEPMPAIHERLEKNIAVNGLSNIQAIRAAASDRDGVGDFYHGDDPIPSSSSLSRSFMEVAHRATLTPEMIRSTAVPLVQLDNFLSRYDTVPVGLVKIDTESTEPDVLRGLEKVLRRDRPAIFCEVMPWFGTAGPLQEILEPLGYRFYHLTPRGPEPRPTIEGHPELHDYLFTPMGPEELADRVDRPENASSE